MSMGFGFLGVLALRMAAREFSHSDVFKRRVLVLGAGRNASLINSAMRRKADRRAFCVLGFVELPNQECLVPRDQVLGGLDPQDFEAALRVFAAIKSAAAKGGAD